MPMQLEPRWLPTGKATELLGISRRTLVRLADEGALQPGEHFRRNPSTGRNPGNWRWEVNAINAHLAQRAALEHPNPKKETTPNDNNKNNGLHDPI